MSEMDLIYILAGAALVSLVCIIFLIFMNRGLNNEVRSLSQSYLNLSAKLDETKNNDQQMIQTMSTSIGTFGDIISRNQKDSAEAIDRRLVDMGQRISNMALENETKLNNVRQTMETQIGALKDDNNKALEKMRETVDEKLQKTLEDRISQSFKLVSERLQEVYEGLGEMKNLATGVGDLKKVLTNVKTRGILGEVQLKAILEQVLGPEQYAENVATIPDSKERVEFAVVLPGADDGNVYLPIDSKFPGDRYNDLVDAYESGEKEQIDACWKALETVIKQEAKDIKEKYVMPPYTTEYGIMFLPFEGLYAEVVRHGLLEVLQRDYKVNIAGPTTMAALLNSLQMGFKTLAIQKHSSEVWEVLGAVKTEFGNFEKVLESARNRIRMADEDLEKLVGTRSRAISRKLRAVEQLPLGESKEILELPGLDDDWNSEQ